MKSWKKYVTALCTAALTYIIIGGTIPAGGQERTDGKHTDFDGVVRLDRTIQDFGEVMMSQGPLSCTFTVTNISKKPIVIYNVVSSCGCTAVKWTREPLVPGKTGTISATYSNDEGPYPFDKTLTVYFSDVKKPVVLRLRGVVRAKKVPLTEIYKQRRGALALKKTEIKLGNLYQGGQRGDAVTVANVGTAPATISFADVTPGLKISVAPSPIPAGGTAKMTYIVTSDGKKWGKNYYYATPVVNGVKKKPISVWTFTAEDFSNWTDEQRNNASQPVFDYSTCDLGTARKGEVLTANFRLKNLGGSAFHVYKADPENVAITPAAKFEDVASGATGVISFRVDTGKLTAGLNDVLILLTTNCPLRPMINLHVTVTVK